MNLHNKRTDKEEPINPDAVPPHKGMSWDRPEDRARFVEAGYSAIEDGDPVPDGMIATGVYRYTEKDAETVIRTALWITPAELDAQNQAQQDAEAESVYELQDAGLLLKAFAIELKVSNPVVNLPTKEAVVARFKTLKGWS